MSAMGCFKVYSLWNKPYVCKVAHCKGYLVFVCALTFWQHVYCVSFSCIMLQAFTSNSLFFIHTNYSLFMWISLLVKSWHMMVCAPFWGQGLHVVNDKLKIKSNKRIKRNMHTLTITLTEEELRVDLKYIVTWQSLGL